MFTRDFLASVRRKALRRKVWYSALDSVERGILSLTPWVVDRVESRVLGVELVKIIAKLKRAVKSKFVKKMETFGVRRAREVCNQALEFGYETAESWAFDFKFIQYLTLQMQQAGVERVAPSHCSGYEAIHYFKEVYKDSCLEVKVGTELNV